MNPVSVHSASQALVLLMLFVAISGILGGGRWALRLVLAPIRMILKYIENRIARMVTLLVLTVLAGYGILPLLWKLFR